MSETTAEYDSPWKVATEHFFERLMKMLCPKAHADINWSRGFEFLDKELRSLLRESETGAQTVDILVKVWRNNGEEAWVLVHIEIQAQQQSNFPERVYIYNYRIYDHFRRPVMSLAILTDDNPNWRPDHFSYDAWGCKPSIEFPVIKLLDYEQRWEELEASDNPFAVVIMAHLKTLSSRSDVDERYRWKLRLTRMLFHKGWVREDVVYLLRFMDWVLTLPPELENKLELDVAESEGVKKMEMLANFELRALKKGILQQAREGVLQVLEVRFHIAPPEMADALRQIEDTARLNDLHKKAILAASLEEFRQAMAS